MILRHSPDVLVREVDGEVVAYAPRSGLAHMLNASATSIWHAFDGRRSLDDITKNLAGATDADPAVVERDVVATARHLLDQGLLEPVQPAQV